MRATCLWLLRLRLIADDEHDEAVRNGRKRIGARSTINLRAFRRSRVGGGCREVCAVVGVERRCREGRRG